MTNIEIIANSKKIKTVEDILKNIDLISDLIKEDVKRIIRSAGFFIDELFEEKYAAAIKWTKKQLDKHHLLLYQRIYKCKNIKQVLNLLLIRITNNVRNQFDSKRKGTVAYFNSQKKGIMNEEILEKMTAEDPLEILLDQEMQILTTEAKQESLTNYKNEIRKIMKVEKTKNNYLQLALNF